MPDLCRIEYQKISKHDIAKAIANDFSGDIKKALSTIVACSRNAERYWAEQIIASMKGIGTNDAALCRYMVSLHEKNLRSVSWQVAAISGDSLRTLIEAEVGGDCKKLYLSLIKE